MIIQVVPLFYCVYMVMARGVSYTSVASDTKTSSQHEPKSSLRTTSTFAPIITPVNILTTTELPLRSEDDMRSREARGMMMLDYDHDLGIDEEEHHKEEPVTEQPKAVKGDPWAGYYDFLINEGSFKFWAAFQLATAVLLIYSAFAAVYYAKFNPISSDYDYYDDFFKRRSLDSSPNSSSWFGMDTQTFQRIIDAITSKKYS